MRRKFCFLYLPSLITWTSGRGWRVFLRSRWEWCSFGTLSESRRRLQFSLALSIKCYSCFVNIRQELAHIIKVCTFFVVVVRTTQFSLIWAVGTPCVKKVFSYLLVQKETQTCWATLAMSVSLLAIWDEWKAFLLNYYFFTYFLPCRRERCIKNGVWFILLCK